VLSALRSLGNPRYIDFIYDIACEYWKNLMKRVRSYDNDLKPEFFNDLDWRFLIPKVHLGGHGSKCQVPYSLNWNRGCGRTFSEMIEQEWAHIKKCGPMTREQGPGARHLTLDNQWSGWNWRCLLGLGTRMKFTYESIT
jgi:hypothetical protein